MESATGPDGQPDRGSATELHGDQRVIFEWLLARDENLAAIYLGALFALDDRGNPDRIPQSAHSLRELIEGIREALGVRIASLSDLSAQVEVVESALESSRESACFDDGTWEGSVDDPLRDLLQAIEDLAAWREANRMRYIEAVRETLRMLDPSGRGVPGTLGDENVSEWLGARKYFTRVCHHGPVEEGEFRERIVRLERFLVTQMNPRPFADFDEIDAILSEAESAD